MKSAKRFLLFMLVGALSAIPAFPSMANSPQGTMEADEGDVANPRALLTHSKYVWNGTYDIQFHVTYVVNDGTNRIVDIKDSYVSDTSGDVYRYTNTSEYIAPDGAYARISCDYTLKGSSDVTHTAIVTIYPF